MERENQFFYVFINIKGALYTADWVKFTQSALLSSEDSAYQETLNKMLNKHPEWKRYYTMRSFEKSKHIRKICPFNVDSLNRLLDDLKLDYDVNLVITTPKWKEAFDIKAVPALVKNGLNYKNLIIDKTGNYEDDIAQGINAYLAQVGNPNSFLVIDYQDSVCRNFDPNKIIKVDQYETGLTDEMVDDYLDNYNIDEEYLLDTSLDIFGEHNLVVQ